MTRSRCEDYPCCGHTDGFGCGYTTDYYRSSEYQAWLDVHAYCDHETGAYACDPI